MPFPPVPAREPSDPTRAPAAGRRRLVGVACALAAGLPLLAVSPLHAAELPVSTPLDEARRAVESGRATLIDVREPEETAAGVVAGAKLLPSGQIASRLAEIPKDGDRPVLLICRTSNRSKAAVQALRQQGYTQVQYVEGGMAEWMKRGWPTVAPAATPAR